MSQLRDLLTSAAGPASEGDQHWHAESVSRLYFSDPSDLNSAGQVDVHNKGADVTEYVRVELWVRPELAAEIIALVTGQKKPLAERLQYVAEQAAAASVAALVSSMVAEGSTLAVEAPVTPAGPAKREAAPTRLQEQDAARIAELNKLISEQSEDDEQDDE